MGEARRPRICSRSISVVLMNIVVSNALVMFAEVDIDEWDN